MKNKLKLYVGCGLTNAPDSFCDQVAELKEMFRGEYEVFDFVGKVSGTAEEVYRWDIERCVATCDVFLAVCDYASTGLGWELSEAIGRGKRVIGVAHDDAVISRLIIGAAEVKPNFSFHRYQNFLEEVPALLVT
jgi:nucleoside 2-deoxyribosyltransferase